MVIGVFVGVMEVGWWWWRWMSRAVVKLVILSAVAVINIVAVWMVIALDGGSGSCGGGDSGLAIVDVVSCC